MLSYSDQFIPPRTRVNKPLNINAERIADFTRYMIEEGRYHPVEGAFNIFYQMDQYPYPEQMVIATIAKACSLKPSQAMIRYKWCRAQLYATFIPQKVRNSSSKPKPFKPSSEICNLFRNHKNYDPFSFTSVSFKISKLNQYS